METLTKTEERVMQILWAIKKGFVKDVLEHFPDPKPPYNTVSSVIRLLEKKGFVAYLAYGKTHEYYPLISKFAYKKLTFKNFIANYFEGSFEKVVSFMVEDEKLSPEEILEIKELIDKHAKENKTDA